MTTLRCTAKLLTRLGISNPGEPPPPENRLGDWFANIIYTRYGHYVLLVSERSLLPVVTTARDLDNLEPRFVQQLDEVLRALGVSEERIDRELAAMEPLYFGRTNSPSTLGSMNDFVYNLKGYLETYTDPTLLDLSLALAHIPCGPLAMESPESFAPRLLKNPLGFEVINDGAD
jgi:hypothetical protein